MARRRRRAGVRALWAPIPVDVNIEHAHPLPEWVALKELFVNNEHTVAGTDVVLAVARPFETNTMHGEVMAIHPMATKLTGVGVGDIVIYKEFSGGRWSFNGDKFLITPLIDLLAKVE